MSLEHELANIDPERVVDTLNSFYDQVHDGRLPQDFSPDIEDKYPGLTAMIDGLYEKVFEDAKAGELAPPVARMLGVGARLGALVLIEFAESQTLRETFGDTPQI